MKQLEFSGFLGFSGFSDKSIGNGVILRQFIYLKLNSQYPLKNIFQPVSEHCYLIIFSVCKFIVNNYTRFVR
jgi:hypothetical protein